MGALDPRLGDVRTKDPLVDDLGPDRDRLTTGRRFDHREAVMHRIQPGLKPRGEIHSALATQPELQLDRVAGPLRRDRDGRGQRDRELDDGPEIAEMDLARDAVEAGE